MDRVLSRMPYARCYTDVIVIWSEDLHLLHIHAVFGRLRTAGLKVQPGKCEFAVEAIDFLGHRATANGP